MKTLLFLVLCFVSLPFCGAVEAHRLQGITTSGNVTFTHYGSAVAVNIREYGFTGSRYALTAEHVVKFESDALKLEITPGKWTLCRVVSRDSEHDLALLEASDDLETCEIEPDSDLVLSGSPEGSAILTRDAHYTIFVVSSPMAHGMSGGGMFSHGKLQGIIVAAKGNEQGDIKPLGYVVSSSCVRYFLSQISKDKK